MRLSISFCPRADSGQHQPFLSFLSLVLAQAPDHGESALPQVAPSDSVSAADDHLDRFLWASRCVQVPRRCMHTVCTANDNTPKFASSAPPEGSGVFWPLHTAPRPASGRVTRRGVSVPFLPTPVHLLFVVHALSGNCQVQVHPNLAERKAAWPLLASPGRQGSVAARCLRGAQDFFLIFFSFFLILFLSFFFPPWDCVRFALGLSGSYRDVRIATARVNRHKTCPADKHDQRTLGTKTRADVQAHTTRQTPSL